MKKAFHYHIIFIFCVLILNGCAQTKQYVPSQPVGANYKLSGMPSDLVLVQVNDLRAEKNQSEQLTQTIKGQVLSALSTEQISGQRKIYKLNIDIIEHRSYFTLGNWNALTRLRIRLLDPAGKIMENWVAEGKAHRSNMWGYATAKAVSQDAYNIAIADVMSTLSSISLITH